MVRSGLRSTAVVLALAIAALTGACRGDPPDEVRSDRDRAEPAAGAAQLAELARGRVPIAPPLPHIAATRQRRGGVVACLAAATAS